MCLLLPFFVIIIFFAFGAVWKSYVLCLHDLSSQQLTA
jgi:hypothetical protein